MRIVAHDNPELAKQYNYPHIPRFSYRKGFEPIDGTKFTSDKGWGCCFRSCQGLLCRFILNLELHFAEKYDESFGHICPLALFADRPSAPFGIHNLVEATARHGLKKGEWAKPSILAVAIKDIMKEHGIGCIVAQDFSIVKSACIDELFPAILLIPGLFGMDKFDKESFMDLLTTCFREKDSCLGIISGKGNSAYYFFGVDMNTECFLYFDPHTTQCAVVDETGFPSYYVLPGKQLNADYMNPSMLIGFIVANNAAFDELLDKLTNCKKSPIAVTTKLDEEMAQAVLDIDDLDL